MYGVAVEASRPCDRLPFLAERGDALLMEVSVGEHGREKGPCERAMGNELV